MRILKLLHNNTQVFRLALAILILVGILMSCSDSEEMNWMSVEVELLFPEGTNTIEKSGVAVTIRNDNKAVVLNQISDENGRVLFSEIEPGLYTINASADISIANRTRVLNGVMTIEVIKDCSTTLDLKMAEIGQFVISQYYFSGSRTPNYGKYISDQFVEIYNNSGDTLYADNLSIVELEADGNAPSEWKVWEPTHLVVKCIWTIPGKGKEVPLAAGESLVLAIKGFNHKSDIKANSNSPVDLGNADFEFYLPLESGGEIDYPKVPNLELNFLARTSTTKYNFGVHGGSALALAWLPENKQDFVQDNLVPMKLPNAIRYFCKIPNEFVEDAVEVVWNDKIFKRIDPSLDAGYTLIENGTWCGLCVRRKVEKAVDGRKVLKDTNNSTEDFDHDVVPVPRYFEMN